MSSTYKLLCIPVLILIAVPTFGQTPELYFAAGSQRETLGEHRTEIDRIQQGFQSNRPQSLNPIRQVSAEEPLSMPNGNPLRLTEPVSEPAPTTAARLPQRPGAGWEPDPNPMSSATVPPLVALRSDEKTTMAEPDTVAPEEEISLEDKYATLPPLTQPKSRSERQAAKSMPFSGDMDVQKFLPVAGALCLVLGVFFLFVLIARKVGPKSMRGLPKEAFEVLGQTNLTPKLQLHLLRLGHHLALVSVTADGVNTVAEVTDPDEVAFVLGVLKKGDPNGSNAAFNRVLQQYAKEPAGGGYFGAEAKTRPMTRTNAEPEEESIASILAGGGRGLGQRTGTRRLAHV